MDDPDLLTKSRLKSRLFLLDLLWVVIAFAIGLIAACGHMLIGLNNDNLTLIDQANKMLHGAVPYVDFIEVTPPLVHLLYLLPVLAAKMTDATILTTLHAMMFAAIAAGLLVTWKILRHSRQPLMTSLVAMSALVLAWLAVSFLHQSFAQRDYLMLVLITPWLALYSPLTKRAAIPSAWRITAAVMAAVGFAIKPYFYIFYLATVGFHLCSGRSLREQLRQTEHKIVLGFGVVYLLAVFIFFSAYPFTVVPLGWHTYDAISWPLGSKIDIIKQLLETFALPGVVATILLWFIAPALWDRTLAYLLVLLITCTLSYLLNAGWYYTQYPFIAVAFVLTIASGSKLILWFSQFRDRVSLLLLIGALAAAMYHYFAIPIIERASWDILTQKYYGHPLERGAMGAPAYAKISPHLDSHPRFMFFTTNLWSVTLLREGTPRENVGRFDFLWPFPGILQMENNPAQKVRYERLSAYLAESIADDLKRHSPDMVMNDISPYQRDLPLHYNILPWLLRNPAFAEAWQDYKLVDIINTCGEKEFANCAYEIYYRK